MKPSFTVLNKVLVASFLLVCSVGCTPLKKGHHLKADFVFDWRDKGVISPVSDQGEMGASIAFVIAEGVESLLAIQTQKPVVVLSRPEVADCCDDWLMPLYSGYDCIILIGGLCTEAAYNTSKGSCGNNTCQAVGKVTKSGYIEANREDQMVEVIHQTTLTALIDASHDSFQAYVGGIYSEPNCSSVELDHWVQVVGYGTESNVDYWIIKNSWGVDWGERGYMRILRGKNMCGIATSTFYPINQQ